MSEFLIEFAVDGQLTVAADTVEAAQRAAIDALECVNCMDAESFEPLGCTVKVVSELNGDEDRTAFIGTPVDGRVQCVEFR